MCPGIEVARDGLFCKNLAKDGEAALQRPINMELLQHLLEGAVERENFSDKVTELREAVSRDVQNNTLAISGRQALGSAAEALQEELAVIKELSNLFGILWEVPDEGISIDRLTPLQRLHASDQQ